MGRVRKTARFAFSIGGYDGISPIAKESTRDRLLREQNELIAQQTRLLEGAEVRRETSAARGVCPKCSLPVTWESVGNLPYVHVATGLYDCSGEDPSVLKGLCPKCSRPVMWHTERDKTPVHTATGKFECPPDADSQDENKGVAAELERLAAVHSSGMLDDEEFRAAKARIIHGR